MRWFIAALLVVFLVSTVSASFSDDLFAQQKDFCPGLFDSGLTMEQRDYLLGVSRNLVLESFGLPVQELAVPKEAFPKNPNRAYVTFLVEGAVKASQGSAETDLVKAVEKATKSALKDSRFDGLLSKEQAKDLVIWLDILSPLVSTKNFAKEFVPGFHGVKVTNGKDSALFKPSVAVTKGYSNEKLETQLCKKAGLADECFSASSSKVQLFSSDNFIEDHDKKALVLISSVPPVLPHELSREKILDAGKKMAYYWLNNQSERGDSVYELNPVSGKESTNYNVVREIASVWVEAEYAAKQNDSAALVGSEKSADYFLSNWTQAVQDGRGLAVMENGDSKLGSNALLLAALIEIDSPAFEESRQKLLNLILSQQQPNGSLDPYLVNKNTPSSDQQYYPGEALVALALEYQKNPKPEILGALKKAFVFYREYWRQNKNTAMVPWHSRAYYHLYQFTGEKEVADFVLEMNDWLLGFQVTNSLNCSNVGGFRSTRDDSDGFVSRGAYSTGAYAEAFVHAFALADQTGDLTRRESYRQAVLLAFRQALELQVLPENSFWMPAGEKALGGLRTSVYNNSIRIDNQQHVLMAMLDSLQFFKEADFSLENWKPNPFEDSFLVPTGEPHKFARYSKSDYYCSVVPEFVFVQ